MCEIASRPKISTHESRLFQAFLSSVGVVREGGGGAVSWQGPQVGFLFWREGRVRRDSALLDKWTEGLLVLQTDICGIQQTPSCSHTVIAVDYADELRVWERRGEERRE